MCGRNNDAAPVFQLHSVEVFLSTGEPRACVSNDHLPILPSIDGAALELTDRHPACRRLKLRTGMDAPPAAVHALVPHVPLPQGAEDGGALWAKGDLRHP
jgi:hypothetical protein